MKALDLRYSCIFLVNSKLLPTLFYFVKFGKVLIWMGFNNKFSIVYSITWRRQRNLIIDFNKSDLELKLFLIEKNCLN